MDAEYRIVLTTYDQTTYNRTLLKEGFLHQAGPFLNLDQFVLDLPTNDTNLITKFFDITVSPVETRRTHYKDKGVLINVPCIEINEIKTTNYHRSLVVRHAPLIETPNEFKIAEHAIVSVKISAALFRSDDGYLITSYNPEDAMRILWTAGSNPIVINTWEQHG